MISLSYHYYNSRRREREAIERRSSKERKHVEFEQQFGSQKNLAVSNSSSQSTSPRNIGKLKKQKSASCLKASSMGPFTTNNGVGQQQQHAPSMFNPFRKFSETKKKSSIKEQRLLKKTLSCETDSSAHGTNDGVKPDDINGLVTVREGQVSVSPQRLLSNRSTTEDEPTGSEICSTIPNGQLTGQPVDEAVTAMAKVCLAKPEDDCD